MSSLLLAGLLGGCATRAPLPQVDLHQPGWTVHQGQAVWHLEHGQREVAGDLLLATGPRGAAFVQFSKTPFPLVIAQSDEHQWQVEFPPQNKHYSGPGRPPKRLIWLYLARALAGEPLPAGWQWHQDNAGWQLTNGTTGESVEGYFGQ